MNFISGKEAKQLISGIQKEYRPKEKELETKISLIEKKIETLKKKKGSIKDKIQEKAKEVFMASKSSEVIKAIVSEQYFSSYDRLINLVLCILKFDAKESKIIPKVQEHLKRKILGWITRHQKVIRGILWNDIVYRSTSFQGYCKKVSNTLFNRLNNLDKRLSAKSEENSKLQQERNNLNSLTKLKISTSNKPSFKLWDSFPQYVQNGLRSYLIKEPLPKKTKDYLKEHKITTSQINDFLYELENKIFLCSSLHPTYKRKDLRKLLKLHHNLKKVKFKDVEATNQEFFGIEKFHGQDWLLSGSMLFKVAKDKIEEEGVAKKGIRKENHPTEQIKTALKRWSKTDSFKIDLISYAISPNVSTSTHYSRKDSKYIIFVVHSKKNRNVIFFNAEKVAILLKFSKWEKFSIIHESKKEGHDPRSSFTPYVLKTEDKKGKIAGALACLSLTGIGMF